MKNNVKTALRQICFMACLAAAATVTTKNQARTDERLLTKKTAFGMVRGARIQVAGKNVLTFRGLPFAKAPVRELRYRPPQNPDPWSGVLNCTKPAPVCCQRLLDPTAGMDKVRQMLADGSMSEDCLKLNVWVPQGKRNLTTMVWIHGGGFFSGSASDEKTNGALVAAMNDVIVVTISYRLGPFGFLFLDDNLIQANLGLQDQRHALLWVHRNIASFGGNRDKVTIMGSSAGAAAVTAHLIARKSWPYFRSAIVHSGVITTEWAQNTPRRERIGTNQLLTQLGCNSDDLASSVECLRLAEPAEILLAAAALSKMYRLRFFVPVNQDSRFFRGLVAKLLQKGAIKRCPLLIGQNTDDGSFLVPLILPQVMKSRSEPALNRTMALKVLAAVFQNLPAHARKAVFLRASNRTINGSYTRPMMSLNNDHFFTCPIKSFVEKVVPAMGQVFLYHYGERHSKTPMPPWMGVAHEQEIQYVFGHSYRTDVNSTDEEKMFSLVVMKLWTSFAKYGRPNAYYKDYPISWSPYSLVKPEHLYLSMREIRMQEVITAENCEFFESLKKQRVVIKA